jgi:hypothetical protein
MPKTQFSLDQPAIYRIRVYGTLDARWSERMEDMRITHSAMTLNQTVLTGKLTDQAALFGVLNSLYTLGMFLLQVEHLESVDGRVIDR